MTDQPLHPIKIFYCYAHEDDSLRKQLARHLSPLRRLRHITGWFDRDIRAGTDWERECEVHIDAANIILLLISADFFASDYCYTVEMQRALAKHKTGTACVIPILLRPVEWESTPIGELSALPTDKKPVTQWADRDKAWLNVVQGIREVIKKLLPKHHLSLKEADILYPEQGPLSGQTVGSKYLLGELIGEGGFSQVYKAQHLQIGRQQAIKVLLERHSRKREFRDRFLREAQTVASLDHPNIIHLDDFGIEEASQAYLVMPFIGGGTLQDVLEDQQVFLEQHQIVFYLEQICAALDYAHERGIVHLDLKPQNLLVHEDGRLLLSDFGLAHLMKQGAIEGGASLRVGTPHYMAPEHIKGSPLRQSDIFSLGVILYQMLVGQLPFDGLPHETILLKNMTEWPPAPRALRPELSQAVEDMLGNALAKLAEQRYQTANEFLAAFKKAVTASHHQKPPSRAQYSSVEEGKQPSLPQNDLMVSSNALISMESLPAWLYNADSQPQRSNRSPDGTSGRVESKRVPSRPRGETVPQEQVEVAGNVFASMLGVASSDPKKQVQADALLENELETTMKRPAVRLQPMQTTAGRASAASPAGKGHSVDRKQGAGEDTLSNKEQLLRGYQYQLSGAYDDAMQEYRIIIRNTPELLNEVISNLRALLKLAPRYTIGYRVLGDAYMRQGEYLMASECYNKALGIAKKKKGQS